MEFNISLTGGGGKDVSCRNYNFSKTSQVQKRKMMNDANDYANPCFHKPWWATPEQHTLKWLFVFHSSLF